MISVKSVGAEDILALKGLVESEAFKVLCKIVVETKRDMGRMALSADDVESLRRIQGGEQALTELISAIRVCAKRGEVKDGKA